MSLLDFIRRQVGVSELVRRRVDWLPIQQLFQSPVILCVHPYKLKQLDQYQYLGNCPPTPPLTQQQSIDNNLGLMLG